MWRGTHRRCHPPAHSAPARTGRASNTQRGGYSHPPKKQNTVAHTHTHAFTRTHQRIDIVQSGGERVRWVVHTVESKSAGVSPFTHAQLGGARDSGHRQTCATQQLTRHTTTQWVTTVQGVPVGDSSWGREDTRVRTRIDPLACRSQEECQGRRKRRRRSIGVHGEPRVGRMRPVWKLQRLCTDRVTDESGIQWSHSARTAGGG